MIKKLSMLLLVFLLATSCGSYKKDAEPETKKQTNNNNEEPKPNPEPQEPLFNNASDKQAAIFIQHLLSHLPVYFKNAATECEIISKVQCKGYEVVVDDKYYESVKKDNGYSLEFKNCTLDQNINVVAPGAQVLYDDLCATECSAEKITAPSTISYELAIAYPAWVCPWPENSNASGHLYTNQTCQEQVQDWESCTGEPVNVASAAICQTWRENVVACNACKDEVDSLLGSTPEVYNFYPYPTENYEFTINGKIEITVNEDGTVSIISSDIKVKEENNFIPTELNCDLDASIINYTFTDIFTENLLDNINNEYDFWHFMRTYNGKLDELLYTGLTCGYDFAIEEGINTLFLEDVMALDYKDTYADYLLMHFLDAIYESEIEDGIYPMNYNSHSIEACNQYYLLLNGDINLEVVTVDENNKTFTITTNNINSEDKYSALKVNNEVLCSVNITVTINNTEEVKTITAASGSICGKQYNIEDLDAFFNDFFSGEHFCQPM